MTDVVSRPELLGGISRAKAPEPDLGTAPIAGERYWSPEFAQREWDHMWTKVWLIAGVVNQIPKAGDYLTAEVGRESIICVRGTDERIRAFYNVCQHRGNRLVHATSGARSARASSSARTTAGASTTPARSSGCTARRTSRRAARAASGTSSRSRATRGPGSSGSTWTRAAAACASTWIRSPTSSTATRWRT